MSDQVGNFHHRHLHMKHRTCLSLHNDRQSPRLAPNATKKGTERDRDGRRAECFQGFLPTGSIRWPNVRVLMPLSPTDLSPLPLTIIAWQTLIVIRRPLSHVRRSPAGEITTAPAESGTLAGCLSAFFFAAERRKRSTDRGAGGEGEQPRRAGGREWKRW